MTFPTKKVKIRGLKSAFIFLQKNNKWFIFSFYKVEENVEILYDYPRDAYYES